MTKEQADKLSQEILGFEPIDLEIELEWCKVQLSGDEKQPGLITSLEQGRAAFRFWENERNDSKMEGAAQQVREVRQRIKYMRNRIIELEEEKKQRANPPAPRKISVITT